MRKSGHKRIRVATLVCRTVVSKKANVTVRCFDKFRLVREDENGVMYGTMTCMNGHVSRGKCRTLVNP